MEVELAQVSLRVLNKTTVLDTSASVMASTAVIKHHQKQLGEKGFTPSYTSQITVHYPRKSGQELKAMEEFCLPLLNFPSLLFLHSQD